jgi:hypothetical protein
VRICMHPTRRSSHPKIFGALPALGLLTSIAFAIAVSVASSEAGAAPPQHCPAGTIPNLQTHACDPVKPPTAPAPLPVLKAPPPNAHVPISNCPGQPPCPAYAASCLRNQAGCMTATPAQCAPGYYGASCSACPGGASNSCSSHGSCNSGIGGSGVCSCSHGFNGPACQYSNAVTCSGHGSVEFNGGCICQAGFSGPSCK